MDIKYPASTSVDVYNQIHVCICQKLLQNVLKFFFSFSVIRSQRNYMYMHKHNEV
jgi:hypothetical protein